MKEKERSESRIAEAFRENRPVTEEEIASFANEIINKIAAEIVAAAKK